MQVKEVMTANPACCTPDTPLPEVAKLMVDNDCGEIPVVENRGSKIPIGVLTDRDIVTRAVARDRDPRSIPVSELATPDVITVPGDASVEEAEEHMTRHAVRRLFVVDDEGRAVGIISADDLTAFRYPNSVVAEQLGEWGLGLSDQGFTGHG